MKINKIMPCMWFHNEKGELQEILLYYHDVFGDHFEPGQIISLGDTPSGYSEMVEVMIFNQKYTFMSSSVLHHPFNDAISLIIECDGQMEIDKYWDYFTAEGEAVQCGWCTDKYGLRWQVVPDNMNELMNRPGAFDVMMNQIKIIIDEY